MRFILFLIITTAIVWVASIYLPMLPWWVAPALPFLTGLVWPKHALSAFMIGFLALLFVWGGYAAWMDGQNEQILSEKMGKLFGGLPAWGIVGVTGLIGALLGGLSALSGRLLSAAMRRK